MSAGYGALVALRDVGLAIRQTDIVSVLGANGAGKSTLAATVSGQVRARRGAIRFDGHTVTRAPAYDRARQGICLCPEGRGIFTGLTVAENLLLGVPLRRRRADIATGLDRVYEILPVLRSRAGQRAGSLSGGEQQMLAIGRALLMSPRLLICDELSLGLAPKIAEELYEVLVRVNESGVAILLIEQNVHRALDICTMAYVLNRGQVTFAGPPGELRDESVLAAAYFAPSAQAAAAGPGPRRKGAGMEIPESGLDLWLPGHPGPVSAVPGAPRHGARGLAGLLRHGRAVPVRRCRDALQHWHPFSSAHGVMMNDHINQALRGIMLCSDPPQHTVLRGVARRPLLPRQLKLLEQLITEEADSLVAQLAARGSFDAAADLAQHLPITIVSKLVGLPEEGREQMLDWAGPTSTASGR